MVKKVELSHKEDKRNPYYLIKIKSNTADIKTLGTKLNGRINCHTSLPSAVYTSLNSSPMYPLPTIAIHCGTNSNLSAWSLVITVLPIIVDIEYEVNTNHYIVKNATNEARKLR